MEIQVATKAEFAALIRVSPGRVSQLISEGKLGASEMQGVGRSAKIKVPEALAALKLRLDMSQMVGNGSSTRLDVPEIKRVEASTPSPATAADLVEMRFKQAKLEQQEAVNRKIAEEEKYRNGLYMLTTEAKAEQAKLAAQLLQSFEGGLTEMASALAAEYKLPQRDVVHMMRNQFREVRQKIAERLQREAAENAKHIDIADTQH
jgi:hypothetical protein